MRFLFDYISHNAYLAWLALPEIAERHGRRVEPVPVLFAGLLGAYGQLGPAEVAPKARWMIENLLRKAAVLGVPLNPPASHPFNPLPSLRATTACANDDRHRLVDALFRAAWVDGREIGSSEVVRDVADEAGLDGAALIAACARADVKQRLRDETEQAVAEGVFGIPTVLVDGLLFWGYDDLPWLDRHLSGDDPLPQGALAAWADVRPTARRRQTSAE